MWNIDVHLLYILTNKLNENTNNDSGSKIFEFFIIKLALF